MDAINNPAPVDIGKIGEGGQEGVSQVRQLGENEVSRFNQALVPDAAEPPSAAAPEVPPSQTIQPAPFSGEAILNGLGQLGGNLHDKLDAIATTAAKPNLEVNDILAMQMKTHEVVMDQTLLGKAGKTVSDTVNTLLKGQ